MQRLGGMTDMALTPSEQHENAPMAVSDQRTYPYGLCIRLTHNELEKLNVDYSDWAVGDHFHLEAMAKITSISENETESGKNCCVEMQIVALRGHSEEDEYKDDDADEY